MYSVISGFCTLFSSTMLFLTIGLVFGGNMVYAVFAASAAAMFALLARTAYKKYEEFTQAVTPTPEVQLYGPDKYVPKPPSPGEFAELLRPDMYDALQKWYPIFAKRMSHAKKADLVVAYTTAYNTERAVDTQVAEVKQSLVTALAALDKQRTDQIKETVVINTAGTPEA